MRFFPINMARAQIDAALEFLASNALRKVMKQRVEGWMV